MKNVFLWWIALLVCLPALADERPTEELIATLDTVLAKSQEYAKAKDLRINQLRRKIAPQMNDEERLWLNKLMFDEYAVYMADSAMAYVDANIDIAHRLGRTSLEQEWKIQKALILATQGLLHESQLSFEQVDLDAVSRKDIYFYYETAIYIYTHLKQFIRSGNGLVATYDSIANSYKQKALSVISPSHPSYYVLKSTTLSGPSDPEWNTVRTKLVEQFGRMPHNTRNSAIVAYELACMFQAEGNSDASMNYLLQSAIADVYICNRDIASLEELSVIFYRNGDIERGYECINYCLKAALMYPNRVRVFNILSVFDEIQEAANQRNSDQEQKIRNSFIVVCVLCALLLIVMVILYLQYVRLKRNHADAVRSEVILKNHMDELSKMQAQLSHVNEELTRSNDKLSQSNEELVRLNYLKEEYVGYVFAICSGYLSKIEDFRKEISRKIKVGKIDEVRALMQNPQLDQKGLREFYHHFDTIFLHLYPDFVEDFNALLRPEERIVLKQGELLNTNLRIYALVRLGINDSVKISEFLHMSPQTVYNNRLKVRNSAIDGKDKFIDKVRQLGKNHPV